MSAWRGAALRPEVLAERCSSNRFVHHCFGDNESTERPLSLFHDWDRYFLQSAHDRLTQRLGPLAR
jgi:hypothetical protein